MAALDSLQASVNKKSNRPSTTHGPTWQLPDGVAKGNWDYIKSPSIARNYDRFLADDPLAAADGELLAHKLPPLADDIRESDRPRVADFGCGNGRSLLPVWKRGYRAIGIDLSESMLGQFREKTKISETASNGKNSSSAQRLTLIQANLVELDFLPSQCLDAALCMFSTLGMIRGITSRDRFLCHVHRLLKQEGMLILHAHNLVFQLRTPGGLRRFIGDLARTTRGRQELGDRISDYRGVRNVFIHSFRRRELQLALTNAGFEIVQWYSVMPGKKLLYRGLPFLSDFRVVGWIVVCRPR